MAIVFKYEVSNLSLGKDKVGAKAKEAIIELTKKTGFDCAVFVEEYNYIRFSNWPDYDTFIDFLKQLTEIRGNVNTHVKVTDTVEKTYWLVRINGKTIEELHGVILWGFPSEKAKIKSILDAHLDTTPEVLNQMTEEIIDALKGYYSDDALKVEDQIETVPLEEADKDANILDGVDDEENSDGGENAIYDQEDDVDSPPVDKVGGKKSITERLANLHKNNKNENISADPGKFPPIGDRT